MKSHRSLRLLPRFGVLALFGALACQRDVHEDRGAGAYEEAPPVQVAIVGGGLAGLVAAHALEKRGISVHVLEATERLGGRVATADYGPNLRGEFGMQEIWEGNPLLEIAAELSVPVEEGEPAYSSVVIDGKLYPYIQDTDAEFFATLLSPEEKKALDAWQKSAKELYGLATSKGLADPRVQHLQEVSFKDWLAEFKLPNKAAQWIRLTIQCELASDWDEFSALFGLLEFHTFFDGGVPCHHIAGGNNRLIEALAGAIKGPKTLLATVTAVRRQRDAGGRLHAEVTYLRDNRVHTLKAERVVLAVPFVRIHQIAFEPPLSGDHWQAIYTLRMGQYTVVHLIVGKEVSKVWTASGESPAVVLTDGPLGVIYGVTETTPAAQPLAVFSLLIYGASARAFHMAPRESRVREVLAGLDGLWPGLSSYVHDSFVYTYHPAAIPVWPVGRSPLDQGSELLRKPVDGLYLAGDYTLNSHSDGAARSGLRVAEQIASELAAAK